MKIYLDKIRSARYEQNLDNEGGEDSSTCICCGKRVTTYPNCKMVHLLTTGELATNDDTENELSQGCFAIGNNCAKKVPSNYIYL
jgi:hypothetical protein